jgi:Flp pilus assembly CpaE family ATPase
VIAGPPQLEREVDADAVGNLLADARAAHALTVVDCGTLQGPADRTVLAAATHIAWVLPATRSGVIRARRALEVAAVGAGRPQLVIARRDPSARKAPTDELKALAELQLASLVLMPHVPDLAEEPVEGGMEAAALTLEAIRGALRR